METYGQTSRIDVVRDGSVNTLVLHDEGAQNKSTAVLGSDVLNTRAITTRDLERADLGSFQMEGRSRSLDRDTLERLTQGGSDSATAFLDGVGFYGNAVMLHALQSGGQDYVYMSRPAGEGIAVYTRADSGALSLRQTVADTDAAALAGITAMDSTTTAGGQTFLIAASQREDGVTVFSVADNGRLSVQHSFGAADQLPVDQPSVMQIVETGAERFVVLGGHGTGSLTVLGLSEGGALRFIDQVNDTRDTRFDGISALDHLVVGNTTLLAVGGSDGGISLFQLLPGGRLMLHESIEDGLDTALDGIRDLRFVEHADGSVELLALSSRDNGLTRFDVDTGVAGITATGRNGEAGNDILTASGAGGRIQGGAGDDILIDGTGSDRLEGGAGADVFVFSPDGRSDTVSGFDISEDRIDLSAYGAFYDVSSLEIRAQGNGARISFGDEDLVIQTVDGARLTAGELGEAIMFDAVHVIMPERMASSGGAANDEFLAGAGPDTVDGGAGFDTLSFEMLATPVTVNLTNSAANAQGAAGYVIRNIEGITGTAQADNLTGSEGGDNLTGGAGNDTIWGGGGGDWITPGVGSDHVDGGTGNDMVSFADLAQGVTVDLRTGLAVSGRDTDRLSNIEGITGTIFGDFITGNDADNRIRALGDYDWITGSNGRDTIDGGNGRDMISYVFAPSAVTVDLGAGLGLGGQALGDTYISIERVTGSVHSDLFMGSDGADDFRGLGGFDWFVGSGGGRDRYDGGTGNDTVAYTASPGSVAASLLLNRGTMGDAARDLYTSIENLTGSNFADELTGDNGRNVLRGMWGEDTLRGNGGVDRITGGGSDDFIDGGSGWDYAIFENNRADYTIAYFGDVVTVTHNRGGRDGTDTIVNVEVLQFADDNIFL